MNFFSKKILLGIFPLVFVASSMEDQVSSDVLFQKHKTMSEKYFAEELKNKDSTKELLDIRDEDLEKAFKLRAEIRAVSEVYKNQISEVSNLSKGKSVIGVLGSTGAGKSTLLNLLIDKKIIPTSKDYELSKDDLPFHILKKDFFVPSTVTKRASLSFLDEKFQLVIDGKVHEIKPYNIRGIIKSSRLNKEYLQSFLNVGYLELRLLKDHFNHYDYTLIFYPKCLGGGLFGKTKNTNQENKKNTLNITQADIKSGGVVSRGFNGGGGNGSSSNNSSNNSSNFDSKCCVF